VRSGFNIDDIVIRQGHVSDLPFLKRMLYEAFCWNPTGPRPDVNEFVKLPDFQRLLAGWGKQGDNAVIAEHKTTPIGAAWYRFWTTADHSYGFIDPTIPELGIAVSPEYRSMGVGRRLVQAILDVALRNDVHSMSLSVDPHNFALHLYESVGQVRPGR
jgi:GNAT superfamily N-acetyltransferase